MTSLRRLEILRQWSLSVPDSSPASPSFYWRRSVSSRSNIATAMTSRRTVSTRAKSAPSLMTARIAWFLPRLPRWLMSLWAYSLRSNRFRRSAWCRCSWLMSSEVRSNLPSQFSLLHRYQLVRLPSGRGRCVCGFDCLIFGGVRRPVSLRPRRMRGVPYIFPSSKGAPWAYACMHPKL